jgi:cation transport regulator ChaC
MAANIILSSSGKYGPCSDYLFNIVEEMRNIGIIDENMENLYSLVKNA